MTLAALAAGCGGGEYRSARMAAFLHRRSADAQIRLGRAQLRLWRPEEAQESFARAAKLDDKCAPRIAAAYLGAAKDLAALSRDAVAANPLVARYAGLAETFDPTTRAREWLFPAVVRRLPSFDTEQAVAIFRRADSAFDPRQGRTMLEVMQDEIMATGNVPERLLPYYDIAYEVIGKERRDDRLWLARSYASMALTLPESNAEEIRLAIARAVELDFRFDDNPELLAVRARLGESGEGPPLTKMAKTANLLFNIVRAAAAYAKEHHEYPACPSIHSFIGDLSHYANEPLSTLDGWGGQLQCTVLPHRLWFSIESPGPDGEHGRGEKLTAFEVMHRQDDDAPADIYLEAGFYAPPHWSKDDVLKMYGQK
jgi:hypothetical protein